MEGGNIVIYLCLLHSEMIDLGRKPRPIKSKVFPSSVRSVRAGHADDRVKKRNPGV